VLLDRETAEKQTPREERHRYLEQWFPPSGGFRFPGSRDAGPEIKELIYLKDDKKDKWNKKFIVIKQDKLCIYKEHGINCLLISYES